MLIALKLGRCTGSLPFVEISCGKCRMDEIAFARLFAALAHPKVTLPSRARFIIPASPNPFVPPTLRLSRNGDPLAAEVLFIQASAAVGKSTIAAALAA